MDDVKKIVKSMSLPGQQICVTQLRFPPQPFRDKVTCGWGLNLYQV